MQDFIDNWFRGRTIKRHISIGVTNVLTGAFAVFSEHHSTDDLIEMLKASVAFSGLSPAVEFNNELYLSGNIIYENDVNSAIRHCELLGYAEHDIIIDSILSGSIYMDYINAKKMNAFTALVQSSKLWRYYDRVHGILRAKITH